MMVAGLVLAASGRRRFGMPKALARHDGRLQISAHTAGDGSAIRIRLDGEELAAELHSTAPNGAQSA